MTTASRRVDKDPFLRASRTHARAPALMLPALLIRLGLGLLVWGRFLLFVRSLCQPWVPTARRSTRRLATPTWCSPTGCLRRSRLHSLTARCSRPRSPLASGSTAVDRSARRAKVPAGRHAAGAAPTEVVHGIRDHDHFIDGDAPAADRPGPGVAATLAAPTADRVGRWRRCRPPGARRRVVRPRRAGVECDRPVDRRRPSARRQPDRPGPLGRRGRGAQRRSAAGHRLGRGSSAARS